MNTKTKNQVVATAPVEPVIAEVLTQEQISTLSEAGKMFSNADLDKSTGGWIIYCKQSARAIGKNGNSKTKQINGRCFKTCGIRKTKKSIC